METLDEEVALSEQARIGALLGHHNQSVNRWSQENYTSTQEAWISSGFSQTANQSEPQIDCGNMTLEQFELWQLCQYWCEGILFALVGSIGILGNVISILILSTK